MRKKFYIDRILVGDDALGSPRLLRGDLSTTPIWCRLSWQRNWWRCESVLDNNNHKTIVRLRFGKVLKQVGVMYSAKNSEKKKKIEDLTDLYTCAKDIESRVQEHSQIKL